MTGIWVGAWNFTAAFALSVVALIGLYFAGRCLTLRGVGRCTLDADGRLNLKEPSRTG